VRRAVWRTVRTPCDRGSKPVNAQFGASQARPRHKGAALGRQALALGAPEFPDGQTGHCLDTTMGALPAGRLRLPRYSIRGGQ